MGLGYDDIAAVHPAVVYLSVSGFGNTVATPYDGWPAYAAVAEAMSGIYDYKREPDRPPVVSPVGALGDIGTALFGTIGLLAALRHRDRTGEGQYIDVAMFDSMVAMTDLVTNFWSMGLRPEPGQGLAMILDGFKASNGWFIIQVGREHEFERLANLIGKSEWLTDERLATRAGWREHMDDMLRPGVNEWAAAMTNIDACRALADAGVAAGPCLTAQQVIDDPHVAARNMLVEIPRPEGGDPVLTPGNPVKMSKMADGPETRMPWLGEHTDEVLAQELGLDNEVLGQLRANGVIA
jgi:formyl-CoA transferase